MQGVGVESPDVRELWRCHAEPDFAAACDSFAEAGGAGPLPVLRQPWAGRPLADSPAGSGATPRPWPGVVLATTADPGFLAVAAVLAAATGRPLVDEDGLAGHEGPVAYVGPAAEMTAEALARFKDRELGILTGYDLADVSALVARTVWFPEWLATRPQSRSARFVSTEFARSRPDAAETASMAALESGPVDYLVLAGHGRECSFHLTDGTVCSSKGVELAGSPSTGARLSCAHGGDCYYHDFGPERRVAAADVQAAVVFLSSCQTLGLGSNRFAGAASLPLSFLRGDAVAVVASPWIHVQDDAPQVFRRALDTGARLGECVGLANRDGYGRQAAPRHWLLGDPALRFAPSARGTVDPPAHEPDRAHPPRPDAVPQRAAAIAAKRAARPGEPLAQAVTMLEHYDGLEELADAIGEALGAEDLVSAVEALDEAVVCEAVRMTGVSWWQHAGSWWGWSATASSRPARCPECGSNAAEELLLEHVGDAQAVLAATTCPSCGILHEATPGAVDVALVEHQDEFSGRTEVTVRLRAPQGVESAWIGAEVLASVYYDSRVTTEPVLVRFGEAGEAAYTFEVERDQDAPAADLVRVKIFCCAGARLSCRTLGLFARPEGVPAEGGVR